MYVGRLAFGQGIRAFISFIGWNLCLESIQGSL